MNQEAVCGTCGGRRSSVAGNVPRQKCPDCNGTGRIPAPVVPSDDECDVCEEEGPRFRWYARTGEAIEVCEDCLGKSFAWLWDQVPAAPPTPSQDAHAHEWIEVGGSGPYCRLCGQWPSQDAEGDGLDGALRERDEAEAWADRLAYAIAPASVIGEHSSENNPWQNALGVLAGRESAIRAPYEELVKGVHSEFDDLVVACRAVDTASATPGMIQETIDAIARMSTVLARITGNNSSLYNTADAALESLGGRS